jgi:HEAT repeat protein
MSHTSSVLRLQAVLGAGRLGPKGAGCTQKLCEVLRIDQSAYEVRRGAAAALSVVARGDESTGPDTRAIHALLSALGDSALAVRADAVQALITLGPPLEPADLDGERKSILNRLPRENDPVQKIWLRVCLMRLDPTAIKANMPLIVKELSNPKLRVTAAEAIGVMGKEAKGCLDELKKGVNSEDKPENLPFIVMCMWAASQAKGEAQSMLPDVQKWKAHKEEIVRNYATDAEKRIMGMIQ